MVAPAGSAAMRRSPGSATPRHTRRWLSSAMQRVASSGLSCSARAGMASPSRVTSESTALVSGWT
eukprot:3409864-Lingulodinium_polyedra.AAC.1